MAVSNSKAVFSVDIKKVWDRVTSLENYEWRRDVGKIDILEEGRRFVEYTKEGYATIFTITVFEPYTRYEFDMENENMKGHWVGLFSDENGKTVVDFTEDVTAKKLVMKPFVGAYLKKQQAAYIEDLKKAL